MTVPRAEAATDEHEADVIAALVPACPAVAAMHAGRWGEVTTYLPGRRVAGVRVDEASLDVAVVLAPAHRVATLDAQVRAALAPLARGRQVNVHVADLAAPDDLPRGDSSPSAAAEPGLP